MIFAKLDLSVPVENAEFVAQHPWRVEVGEGLHVRFASVRAAAETANWFRVGAEGPGEEVLSLAECKRIAASR